MMTPFDWQEGIGHRAQYVESRLSGGMPVIFASLPEGILIATYRRTTRKIFEIYDCLAMSAVGQQSDVDSLRVAAIDFAHQEGFQRSEQDVTIQRVVTALSQPLKRAFSDFNSSPFVLRAGFAEVGETPQLDQYYVLDYDGDYVARLNGAILVGDREVPDPVRTKLRELTAKPGKLATSEATLLKILDQLIGTEGRPAALEPEVALLERGNARQERFRLLSGGESMSSIGEQQSTEHGKENIGKS